MEPKFWPPQLALTLNYLVMLLGRAYKHLQKAFFAILKQGSIPKHIAFIMDGNRRYATRKKLASRLHGHLWGFGKLQEVLLPHHHQFLNQYSIENFRRPKEEVDAVMHLAKEKLKELTLKNDFIAKNEISVRVLGELDLLPDDVRVAAEEAMRSTQHYQRYTLNICFPYTSTAELLTISNKLLNAVASNEICLNDINATLLNQMIYTNPAPPVDLLVRTSGECRLSEFLVWQSTSKPSPMIIFVNKLWPDFNLLDYLSVLLHYQLRKRGLCRHKDAESGSESIEGKETDALTRSIPALPPPSLLI